MIDARVKVLELSENLDKYISHLESEVRRLTQLINDMRDYDRDEIIQGIVSNDEASGQDFLAEPTRTTERY